MSPAINFGNWLRKKFPWIKKRTQELGEEGSKHVLDLIIESVMSDTDRLAQTVLLKYNLKLVSTGRTEVYEAGEFKFTTESRYVFLHYKGEKLGILKDEGVIQLFANSIQVAWDEAYPPADKQKVREQRAKLMEEAFKEVNGDVS